MTDEEIELIDKLAEVWNGFLELPILHPMDQQEMCRIIHAAQEKIMSRMAWRQYDL